MNEKLTEIITQALSDSQFRQHLLTNPEQALAEYQLTPDEILSLQAMLTQGDEGSEVEEVEQRVSPWVINMP